MPARILAARRQRAHGERGETLIELLVTISIMGVAVVAVLGAIATFVSLTTLHKEQSKAGAYLREYAESLEATVAASPTGYAACGSRSTYQTKIAKPSDIGSYVATVEEVRYLSGTTWTGSCTVTNDSGVQRLKLQVKSPDGRATETQYVVIRKPCRPTDPACT